MAKKRKGMPIRSAGPYDPIYQQGWRTMQTLGELLRKLEAEK